MFKPHIYDEMRANCRVDENGCHVWQGEVDEYGYPVFMTKRHKEKHAMRQDEKMFEHVTGQQLGEDDVLVHTCGNRLCLNVEHMTVLTDPQDKAEWDRTVVEQAQSLFREGKTVEHVMRETGFSRVRLEYLKKSAVRAVRAAS